MGIVSSVDVSISLKNEQGGGFVAGSKIEGNVFLLVKKSFKVDSFRISVEGREDSCVHYTTTETYTSNGQTHTRTRSHYNYAHRDVLRMTIPLGGNSLGSMLDVGSYDLPFEFTLPTSIPSTMYASGEGGHCSIAYWLRLEGGGGGGGSARHKRPFTVKSAPLDTSSAVPFISTPETVNINYCCCCNQGSMIIAANVMNTVVGKGDSLPLQFACQNQSSAEIIGITAEIYEKVTWTAWGRSNHHFRIVNKIDVSTAMTDTDRSSLIKMEKDEVKDMKRQASQNKGLDQSALYQKLYKQITDNEGIAAIQTPWDMNDTYFGGVIHSTHEVRLTVKTPNCITDPTIIIPIRIGNKLISADYSGSPVYGAVVAPESALSMASPVPMGGSNEDPDIILPSAPPTGWLNPVYTSVAVADPVIIIGGYKNDANDPVTVEKTISFESLLGEMEQSVSDLDIVTSHVNDSAWDDVLRRLTPMQFSQLIGKVDLDHNQSKVAAILAENINQFTSNHLIASIRTCSDWNRVAMVQKLLPLCTDISAGGANKVKAELTEWEQTLTSSAFSKAIA